MAPASPGVRLLPNAITVLAMSAGLSAAFFALNGNYPIAIAGIAVAAVLDSLDGRIARLLDATSKMGAELDSLSDAIAFGVSPALVLFSWKLGHGDKIGWIVALVFAVCMILRLARFNTLLDDDEQPPYAKEFFVGVPAPAGGLVALLPLILTHAIGHEGWWSSYVAVIVWTIATAALLISRIPTLSVKTVKVPAKLAALLLVLVALVAAAVITYPLATLAVVAVLYLLHIPFAVRRSQWLAKHPEAWDVPSKERRAIRRGRVNRRIGIRPPLRKVAGAARRAVRLPRRGAEEHVRVPLVAQRGRPNPRRWSRIGLRRNNTRPGDR